MEAYIYIYPRSPYLLTYSLTYSLTPHLSVCILLLFPVWTLSRGTGSGLVFYIWISNNFNSGGETPTSRFVNCFVLIFIDFIFHLFLRESAKKKVMFLMAVGTLERWKKKVINGPALTRRIFFSFPNSTFTSSTNISGEKWNWDTLYDLKADHPN